MTDQLFDLPASKPKMALAKFIGGPLDGQRRKVPEYGPAWVRYYEPAEDLEHVHYYSIKRNTKRTYLYAGNFIKHD